MPKEIVEFRRKRIFFARNCASEEEDWTTKLTTELSVFHILLGSHIRHSYFCCRPLENCVCAETENLTCLAWSPGANLNKVSFHVFLGVPLPLFSNNATQLKQIKAHTYLITKISRHRKFLHTLLIPLTRPKRDRWVIIIACISGVSHPFKYASNNFADTTEIRELHGALCFLDEQRKWHGLLYQVAHLQWKPLMIKDEPSRMHHYIALTHDVPCCIVNVKKWKKRLNRFVLNVCLHHSHHTMPPHHQFIIFQLGVIRTFNSIISKVSKN